MLVVFLSDTIITTSQIRGKFPLFGKLTPLKQQFKYQEESFAECDFPFLTPTVVCVEYVSV